MEVASVQEYIGVTSDFPREGRVFRGAHDATFELVPKVGRDAYADTYSPRSEKHLLRLFKQRAHAFLARPPGSDLEWLAVAQHHGLPTRLLDWSVNPLVALFFAVEKGVTTDAVVYTTHFPRGRSNFDPFKLDKPRKYYPPHISTRIPAQEGLFTVQDPKRRLEDQYSRSPIERVRIPASAKPAILRHLDQLGFNRERLFPGLDGVSTLLDWRFAHNVGKWHGLDDGSGGDG